MEGLQLVGNQPFLQVPKETGDPQDRDVEEATTHTRESPHLHTMSARNKSRGEHLAWLLNCSLGFWHSVSKCQGWRPSSDSSFSFLLMRILGGEGEEVDDVATGWDPAAQMGDPDGAAGHCWKQGRESVGENPLSPSPAPQNKNNLNDWFFNQIN